MLKGNETHDEAPHPITQWNKLKEILDKQTAVRHKEEGIVTIYDSLLLVYT